MSLENLWLPEQTPPQIKPEVTDAILDRILGEGLTRVYQDSLPAFRDTQALLREQLGKVESNDPEDIRPILAVRAGTVITVLAYLESGYDQTVDGEAWEIGNMDAELEGVPEAFIKSVFLDNELQRLLDVIPETREFQDGAEKYDYPALLHIAAGSVRHYLQYAIADAA
jgi:hypothetical protein